MQTCTNNIKFFKKEKWKRCDIIQWKKTLGSIPSTEKTKTFPVVVPFLKGRTTIIYSYPRCLAKYLIMEALNCILLEINLAIWKASYILLISHQNYMVVFGFTHCFFICDFYRFRIIWMLILHFYRRLHHLNTYFWNFICPSYSPCLKEILRDQKYTPSLSHCFLKILLINLTIFSNFYHKHNCTNMYACTDPCSQVTHSAKKNAMKKHK